MRGVFTMKLPTMAVLLSLSMILCGLLVLSPEEGHAAIAFEGDIRINMDSGDAEQENPVIAASGKDVYIIWQDERNGTWDLFSRASHDGGRTFGKEVRVDDTAKTPTLYDDVSDQIKPEAAIGPNGNLFVVWEDDRDGRSLIYSSISKDGGKSFSKNIKIEESPQGTQHNPDISAHPVNGELYVVWEDDRDLFSYPKIYLSHSLDGNVFETPMDISDIDGKVVCANPRVAVNGEGHIHVVWNDDRTWDLDIYMSTSMDGGETFGEAVRVNHDPSNSDQEMPDIAMNETHIFVVWKDQKMTSADIYWVNSTDDGASFKGEECIHLESTSGAQYDPRIEMDSGDNASVVWTSNPGISDTRSDIQATIVYSNGTREPVRTVNDPIRDTEQISASLAISGSGEMQIAWKDQRRFKSSSTTVHQSDIYFTRSTVSGQEGEAPVLEDFTVKPEVGGVGDRYTFVVKYSDAEGDTPKQGYPELHVQFYGGKDRLYDYPGTPVEMNLRMYPSPDYDYRNGEYFIYTLEIERSLDIYSFVTARATSGNSSLVSTQVEHLPVVDDQPPTFERVSPDPEIWHSSNIVPFTVNITDKGSGVEPWTIAYQVFRTDINEWTPWQSRGKILDEDNGTVTFQTDLTLPSSGLNFVHFKATDSVGFGRLERYSQSPDYQLKVDVDPPRISDIYPPSGTVIYQTESRVEANLTDMYSGIDPDSIKISYSIDGVENFGKWENLSRFKNASVEQNDDAYHFSFNLTFAYGVYNFYKIQAKDLLGNTLESTPIQIIVRDKGSEITNRPPGPIPFLQPSVTGSLRPHLTWGESEDPEGDTVYYKMRVFDHSSGDLIVDWTYVEPRRTYYDIEATLEAGRSYYVELVPLSDNGEGELQEGPVLNKTLEVSREANTPPDAVTGFTPRATSDSNPVLSWDKASDPDGDKVYYFIRIGSVDEQVQILPWTSLLTDNVFKIKEPLKVGVYNVDLMSSDGIDFSPISHFTLSVGVYNPWISVQRPRIVVYLGESERIDVTVSNRGYMPDEISMELTGDGTKRTDMTVTLGETRMDLPSGFSRNTSLSINVASDAKPGSYGLRINATSIDGESTYSIPLTLRIVDPDEPLSPDGPSEGDGDETDSADVIVWVLFVVLIVILVALVMAFVMIDKKQREERVEVIEEKRKEIREARERSKLLSTGGRGKGELPSGEED